MNSSLIYIQKQLILKWYCAMALLSWHDIFKDIPLMDSKLQVGKAEVAKLQWALP